MTTVDHDLYRGMCPANERLIRLSTVIQPSVSQMLSDKMARTFKNKKIPPAFRQRLFAILAKAGKGEQEETIQRLTAKIESVYCEKEAVQHELKRGWTFWVTWFESNLKK
jgi:hypothetical protein